MIVNHKFQSIKQNYQNKLHVEFDKINNLINILKILKIFECRNIIIEKIYNI